MFTFDVVTGHAVQVPCDTDEYEKSNVTDSRRQFTKRFAASVHF